MSGPSKGLDTVKVVVGRGVQNYDCKSDSASPEAVGADAKLYDVSCVVQSPGGSQLLSQQVPRLLDIPSEDLQYFVSYAVPAANVGTHFFRQDGAPQFSFDDGTVGIMSKDDSTSAPKNARGNENGPAVDWLRLVRKEGEPDTGIEEVYRVYTAGGAAPKQCSTAGKLTVEYVAVYWMFG